LKTFAVVAVRLIGLWILASSVGGLFWLVSILGGPLPFGEQDEESRIMQVGMIVTPVVISLLLLALSRPIGAFVVHGVADDAPAPDGPSVRGFTQMGVFLLGLFIAMRSSPFIVAALISGTLPSMSLDLWVQFAAGLLLMVCVAPLGKLVNRLRQ
jgi:hypothetical protein